MLKNEKMNGFVIGISGGIDSAVTSALAARTSCPLICIEMPIHQNKNEISRSKDHIKWLTSNHENVKSFSHSLTNVFDKFFVRL